MIEKSIQLTAFFKIDKETYRYTKKKDLRPCNYCPKPIFLVHNIVRIVVRILLIKILLFYAEATNIDEIEYENVKKGFFDDGPPFHIQQIITFQIGGFWF